MPLYLSAVQIGTARKMHSGHAFYVKSISDTDKKMKHTHHLTFAAVTLLAGIASTFQTASAEPGCSATVFFDANYGGPARTLHGSIPFVGPYWNDQISSIIVERGVWIFYWDAGFQGAQMQLGPGQTPFVGPRWNDQISSARCIAPTW